MHSRGPVQLITKAKSVGTEFSRRYFLTNVWTERAGHNAAVVCIMVSWLLSVILILTHLPGNTNSLIATCCFSPSSNFPASSSFLLGEDSTLIN